MIRCALRGRAASSPGGEGPRQGRHQQAKGKHSSCMMVLVGGGEGKGVVVVWVGWGIRKEGTIRPESSPKTRQGRVYAHYGPFFFALWVDYHFSPAAPPPPPNTHTHQIPPFGLLSGLFIQLR